MSKLHVNHIKSFLENTFSEFIDIADLSKKCKEEQHKNMLSRALAAYAISILAPCSAEIASKSIIDGYDDNGVDAIFLIQLLKAYGLFSLNLSKVVMGELIMVMSSNLLQECMT